ncbi:transcriptional regulator [Acidithiobacillus sp. AMEEHan]|uniref:transcriptional regulator n=1 Tax=Acidithiobacillus sp. AMEEHan TaxID=2994951 RepID=UPI0027E4839C|nr:transcriptional regulator [Acidithiobacillus sp. AMEEHan]
MAESVEINKIIHQPVRLKIMAALRPLASNGSHSSLDFSRLKAITGATDGNLGAQIEVLEKAGYISVVKEFHKRRPKTLLSLTASGIDEFDDYKKSLIRIIS